MLEEILIKEGRQEAKVTGISNNERKRDYSVFFRPLSSENFWKNLTR